MKALFLAVALTAGSPSLPAEPSADVPAIGGECGQKIASDAIVANLKLLPETAAVTLAEIVNNCHESLLTAHTQLISALVIVREWQVLQAFACGAAYEQSGQKSVPGHCKAYIDLLVDEKGQVDQLYDHQQHRGGAK
jgi:hypothetical protein